MSRVPLTFVLLAVVLLALPAVAGAKARGARSRSPSGYDISYPQCGRSFPSNVSFGIVGVNSGIVFSANPCLGTGDGSSELAWAERYEPVASLYANTGDPGPLLSKHWPTGQTSPQFCDGSDSTACSYDYGWNAAANSYADAVQAYISLGKLPAGATQTPQPNEWWLDVESANSWEANTVNNVSELQGEVAYLQSQNVVSVGLYANVGDWKTLTGNTTTFSSSPSWRAGAGTRATATSYCGTTGITGGPIKYSQYALSGFDGDVRCF